MKTKIRKIIPWVLPPVVFLFCGFSFKLFVSYSFVSLKYVSHGFDFLLSLAFGSVATVIYLIAMVVNKNQKTAIKAIVWLLSSALIIVVLFYDCFFMFFGGFVSKTDDTENYLDFDDCGLELNEYFELMPSEIPKNAENIVYSYEYTEAFFGGAYAYAEWTLPYEEYNAEKQRLTELLYPRIPYEIDGETIYLNSNSVIGIGQISLNDSENKVSYYISAGEEFSNEYKKDIEI